MSAIVILVQHWAPLLRGRNVTLFCDNKPCVDALKAGAAKKHALNRLLMPTFVAATAFDFSIFAQHVPGRANKAADRLSRNCVRHHFPRSDEMLERLACPQWCWRTLRPGAASAAAARKAWARSLRLYATSLHSDGSEESRLTPACQEQTQ